MTMDYKLYAKTTGVSDFIIHLHILYWFTLAAGLL